MNNWISVDERLPATDVDDSFLVCREKLLLNSSYTLIEICDWVGGNWTKNVLGEDTLYDEGITHWQPLPEPPTERK